MATAPTSPVIRYIRQLAASPPVDSLSDRALLDRFLCGRDEEAFAALVRRHGTLVFGVCRRVLGNQHDAEDAFQATFLVFARRAGSIRRTDSLAPWLHGVACRIARRAKAWAARRRTCEQRVAASLAADHPDDLVWRDLRLVLDEAVARLPEVYRAPFVLHYLHGTTVSEVARQLGCPRGTVAARLARARARLRKRLARRGLALSAGVLGAVLSENVARAAVPAFLGNSTARAAALVAAGKAVGSDLISAEAAALMQGGVKAMQLTKVKIGVLFLLMAGTFGVAVWADAHRSAAAEPKNQPTAPADPTSERPAAAEPDGQRQFIIHCKVFYGDPHGRREAGTLKIVAEPRLMVLEGRPFSFLNGGQQVVADGADKVQFVEFGLSIRGTAKPGKEPGTVFLDVRMDDTTISDQSGDVLRLNSEGTRVLGTFKVGEVVTLRLPNGTPDRQTWAELVVDNAK
jgi:RNA polymerase sigma factor (sigma-70 family)